MCRVMHVTGYTCLALPRGPTGGRSPAVLRLPQRWPRELAGSWPEALEAALASASAVYKKEEARKAFPTFLSSIGNHMSAKAEEACREHGAIRHELLSMTAEYAICVTVQMGKTMDNKLTGTMTPYHRLAQLHKERKQHQHVQQVPQ